MTRPVLRTPLCDLLDIEYPLLLAGMGGVVPPSGPELTAAVSNAGGLGVLGGAFLTPEELAEWIERTRRLTDRPFGVDTLLPMNVLTGPQRALAAAASTVSKLFSTGSLIPKTHRKFAEDFRRRHRLPEPEAEMPPFDLKFIERQIEVVLDLKPAVYVAGLGDPAFLVERARAADIKVGSVIGATRHARRVLAGGVDFVVAQGHDGGGHNSRIGTMALIPQVVDAVAPVPVLGAGAIMDGRGIVAALALGAQGVWCGTVFLATEEANLTPAQKERMLKEDESGTTVSRTMTGKPARFLKSLWSDEFEASGLEPLPMPLQAYLALSVCGPADQVGRADISPGGAGQGVGMVRKIRPAREVFEELIAGACAILDGGFQSLVEFLRASPLAEVDLDLSRDPDPGRDVDL